MINKQLQSLIIVTARRFRIFPFMIHRWLESHRLNNKTRDVSLKVQSTFVIWTLNPNHMSDTLVTHSLPHVQTSVV